MLSREEAIERIKMILEEATANEDAVSYVTSDDEDALDMAIKALEQEPCEDCVSRESVIELMNMMIDKSNSFNYYDIENETLEKISNLPSVTPKGVTVTEFADRCRECGTRYGRYKDFCEYVAKMVLKDDFEENAGANAEFLCRKLSKLGIVKADEDEWVLAEMESEE